MDADKITKLAKAHAVLITEYTGVSKSEAYSLVAQIMQFIAGSDERAGEPAANAGHQPANAPAPRPTGAEMAPGEGAVLAHPGHQCICSRCKGPIYEVIAEVRGRGMGVNAFCQAFEPVGHNIRLNREMLDVLKDANGNTYIDCPICQGVKTLMLIGKYEAVKGTVSPVASVREGEF